MDPNLGLVTKILLWGVGLWDVYTANMRIFDKSNSYNMMLYLNDELRVTLYNTTTSTTMITSGTNTMVVGRWYYVAFTYNGSLGQIYINGLQSKWVVQ